MMDRRRFMHGMAVGAAAVAVGHEVRAETGAGPDGTARTGARDAGTAGSDRPAPAGERAAGEAPWELLSPYRAGDEVGLGWVIGDLSPVQQGGAVLTLQRGFERARVHLCAIDGAPRGIAHTARVDLVLMNDGDGLLPTDESVGRVIKTLSWTISRNEETVGLPPGLLPYSARLDRFGENDALK